MTKSLKPEKNPIGVAFGMLGAAKGGKARAAKLSPERRSAIASLAGKARITKLSAKDRAEIARTAAKARWAKKAK
jgi:hypothetical protein